MKDSGAKAPRDAPPSAGEHTARRWSKPRVTRIGNLRELVRGGMAKLSIAVDGDGRKPVGQG